MMLTSNRPSICAENCKGLHHDTIRKQMKMVDGRAHLMDSESIFILEVLIVIQNMLIENPMIEASNAELPGMILFATSNGIRTTIFER